MHTRMSMDTFTLPSPTVLVSRCVSVCSVTVPPALLLSRCICLCLGVCLSVSCSRSLSVSRFCLSVALSLSLSQSHCLFISVFVSVSVSVSASLVSLSRARECACSISFPPSLPPLLNHSLLQARMHIGLTCRRAGGHEYSTENLKVALLALSA